MMRSKFLDRTDNNEIGQKLLLVNGITIFGIGHFLSVFYWLGKIEFPKELLMNSVKCDAISFATIFIKFMGI